MKSLFRNLWSKKSPEPFRSARPEFESLESREVPTVTFHGGAVLQNVEAQAVYYGSDWNTSAYSGQKAQLDNFLQYIVQSGYMGMLNGAGYGVGSGSASAGVTYAASLNKSAFLTDAAIRSTLQSCINAGALQQPDGNRLYVVYVEDNVAVDGSAVPGVGGTSQNSFLGYHSAFAGTDEWGRAQDIHYAIIAYPGGSVGNAGMSWLSSTNDMTQVTSHELAEAVTDPNGNYKAAGWYDNQLSEVGDICSGQTVYLAGYAVQRISDKNDQPMTPYSAGAARSCEFVLQSGGYLYEYSSSGWTFVSSGVTSLSQQGVDNYGRAMVDYIAGGSAYEFHDGGGSTFLYGNAAQAVAGQGVSYVLFNNGYLDEYHDASYSSGSSWTYVWNGSVQAISAGTDGFGVNSVDVILNGNDAWTHSDSNGWRHLMSGATQISGGPMGVIGVLDQYGNVYYTQPGGGALTWLTSGARQVTTGYDTWGHLTVGVVFNTGAAYVYTPAYNSWAFLTGGVWTMSNDNLGVISVLFGGTNASYFDLNGQHPLTGGSTVAVA